jgi:putative DNA primase/helicase
VNDGERRLSDWIAHGYSATPAEVVAAAPRDAVDDACTDTANGRHFAAEHGDAVRYCYARRSWYLFDGTRWARDEGDRSMALAKATARRMLERAIAEGDTERRRKLTKWAESTLNVPGLRRMLEAAQDLLAIRADEFDTDPDLLNTPTGTVHLPTRELRPHRREDFITKMTAAAYDPKAAHPVVDRFLAMVFPDEQTRGFAQRAGGYSITGHNSEEVALFAHGATAAGKTTLLDGCRTALGDYAAAADFETFAPRKHAGGPREDLARLLGVRWVVVTETPPGRRLAAGLLKLLAGRDPLVVRSLYENSIEVVPAFKVWIAGNVRPPAPADDEAVWRRLREIPFTLSLAPSERDPKVKAILTDPTQGGVALLAWLVAGAKAWYEHGLGTAAAVEAATAEYRSAMDVLGDFLTTATVMDPSAWASVAELRAGLERYGREEGLHTLPDGRALAAALRARGCTERRTKAERGWAGVRLRQETDPEPAAEPEPREAIRAW